jgi:hypothetical protein
MTKEPCIIQQAGKNPRVRENTPDMRAQSFLTAFWRFHIMV